MSFDDTENPLVLSFKRNIRQYMMVFALFAIAIFFQWATGGIFLRVRNLSNLFLQTATVAILAIGIVMVIVTNNIDLSLGSFVGFIGAIAAVLQVDHNWGSGTAILASLAVGLLIGAWHGFWIAYRAVPAFIVTLASMMILRGGILGFTGGKSIYNMQPWFQAIGQDYLSHKMSIAVAVIAVIAYITLEIRKRYIREKYGFEVLSLTLMALKLMIVSILIIVFFGIMIAYKGIPYAWLLVMALLIIFTFISEKTTFGRHLYAIGGNAEAARLSGINIKWKLMCLYMLLGVMSAIAGIVYLARLNAATAQAGTLLELEAIASAVIGGTSLLGGEGSIVGAVIGALVMSSLDNGMSLMNIDVTWQYVVKGLVLLFAVWADIATRKRSN